MPKQGSPYTEALAEAVQALASTHKGWTHLFDLLTAVASVEAVGHSPVSILTERAKLERKRHKVRGRFQSEAGRLPDEGKRERAMVLYPRFSCLVAMCKAARTCSGDEIARLELALGAGVDRALSLLAERMTEEQYGGLSESCRLAFEADLEADARLICRRYQSRKRRARPDSWVAAAVLRRGGIRVRRADLDNYGALYRKEVKPLLTLLAREGHRQ